MARTPTIVKPVDAVRTREGFRVVGSCDVEGGRRLGLGEVVQVVDPGATTEAQVVGISNPDGHEVYTLAAPSGVIDRCR